MAVVELAVHVMVVELDACVTRVFGDDRRTWFRVVLASSDLSVSILATVAIYVSFSERYLGSFELVGPVIWKGCLTFLAIPKMAVDVLGANMVFGYLTTPDGATKHSRPCRFGVVVEQTSV